MRRLYLPLFLLLPTVMIPGCDEDGRSRAEQIRSSVRREAAAAEKLRSEKDRRAEAEAKLQEKNLTAEKLRRSLDNWMRLSIALAAGSILLFTVGIIAGVGAARHASETWFIAGRTEPEDGEQPGTPD